MKKEKLKIKFGKYLNIESENPSKKTIIIVAMVLLYLTIIAFIALH